MILFYLYLLHVTVNLDLSHMLIPKQAFVKLVFVFVVILNKSVFYFDCS